MTAQQVKWASQHDWFRDSEYHHLGMIVRVYDSMSDSVVVFNDFTELKAWAGY